jgi:Protein of unknown function (DUF4232)
VALATIALILAGCGFGGGTKTVTVTRTQTVTTTRTVTSKAAATTPPCTGAELTGTFTVIPGSAGAGQIAYVLSLKNSSHRPCVLQGPPKATLLGATGSSLPTHVNATGPGATARLVLEPGATAVAQARFSPDVAGTGDSQSGTCQPAAHTLQVMPTGGGVLNAAIKPPTSVCEQGTLNFEAFGYAG